LANLTGCYIPRFSGCYHTGQLSQAMLHIFGIRIYNM